MSTLSPFDLNNLADYNYPRRSEPWNFPAIPMFSYSIPTHEELPTMIPSNYYYPMFQNGFNNHGLDILNSIPPAINNLHRERAYLLDSLQHENLKATQLLRKLTPLEEYIKREYYPFNKSKMRKQVSWLKRRLNKMSQQEKAILAQLGQVAYQIQMRERSTQLQNEFLTQAQWLPINYDFSIEQIQDRRLNPAVPPFQPRAFGPNHVPATVWQQQYHQEGHNWQEYTSDLPREYDYSEEISPLDVLVVGRGNRKIFDLSRSASARRTVSLDDTELEQFPSRHNTFSPIPKRLSLPSFPNISKIWRLTDEERVSDLA
jgi:hypothetical protein